MIDPHAHLRDWSDNKDRAVCKGLEIAYNSGINAVFEIANKPAKSKDTIKERLKIADSCNSNIFYGLYGSVTDDESQIKDIVQSYYELFPRVVGLKLNTYKFYKYNPEKYESIFKNIYSNLVESEFRGILSVFCLNPYLDEKEDEIKAVKEQIKFADKSGFQGQMHICHVSLPETLDLIKNARYDVTFRITTSSTPHHLLMNQDILKEKNITNFRSFPSIRTKDSQKKLIKALFSNEIDWIESDHGPVSENSLNKKNIDSLPLFCNYAVLIRYLKHNGMPQHQINQLTHYNIIKSFKIPFQRKVPRNIDYQTNNYPLDCFEKLDIDI